MAEFGPDRAYFGPERADFRSKRADLRWFEPFGVVAGQLEAGYVNFL